MTEQEWLSCADRDVMLNFLRGNVSDRKLRLLLAACCRYVWRKLKDKRSRQAVEVGERYADSLVGKKELAEARSAALSANRDALSRDPKKTWDAPTVLTWSMVREKIEAGIKEALRIAYFLGWKSKGPVSQADLLRDIVGNPFRPIVISPHLLSWNDGVLIRLAQAAYEERLLPLGNLDNTRLAILADALEEAGCTNADILNHCRQLGEHVRGCWVVDLLLGKS